MMKEVTSLVRIKQLFTAPYNTWCNGLCERVNGVLKMTLKKMCQEKPSDRDRYIPAVLFAYREVPQASTGFSPFEMLYGRTVRDPMQVLKALWTEEEAPEISKTYEYVLDLRNRLEQTCKLPRESLSEAQGRHKHHYDKRAKDWKFEVGHKVLVLLPTDHSKLLLQWRGPYDVTEVVNARDYKVKVKGKTKLYPANLLKRYVERNAGGADTAAVGVVEPEWDTDGVVYNESLLELGSLTDTETYKDVSLNSEVRGEQKAAVSALLEEFEDIFTDQPETTNLVQHEIRTSTQ